MNDGKELGAKTPAEVYNRMFELVEPQQMAIGPLMARIERPEAPVRNPRRHMSPATELESGVRMAVGHSGEFAFAAQLGHFQTVTAVSYAESGGALHCLCHMQHVNLASFSLIGPALAHILAARDASLTRGYFHFRADLVTRDDSTGEPEPFSIARDQNTLERMIDDAWVEQAKMFATEGVVLGVNHRFFRTVIGPIGESVKVTGMTKQARLESARRCALQDWGDAQHSWLEHHA